MLADEPEMRHNFLDPVSSESEPPMPQIACPSCGAALALPEHSPVVSIRCPSCKKVFRMNRRSRPVVPKSAPFSTAVTEKDTLPDERPSETARAAKSKLPLLIGLCGCLGLILLFSAAAVVLGFRYVAVRSEGGAEREDGNARQTQTADGNARQAQTAAFSETDPEKTFRWIADAVNDRERSADNALVYKDKWIALCGQLKTLEGRHIYWTQSVDRVAATKLYLEATFISCESPWGDEFRVVPDQPLSRPRGAIPRYRDLPQADFNVLDNTSARIDYGFPHDRWPWLRTVTHSSKVKIKGEIAHVYYGGFKKTWLILLRDVTLLPAD